MIAGQATPAGRSSPTDARLVMGGDGATVLLRSTEGGTMSQAALADLRFDAPMGRAPRKVHFPDGTLFETTDFATLDRLNPSRASVALSTAEAFHPRLMLFVLLTIGAVWLVWRYALSAIVALAVWATPVPFAQVIDRQTLATMDRISFYPSTLTEDETAPLYMDFVRLTGALSPAESHTPMNLQFRGGPMGPNAFALPGGTIVLTDDLVRLSDDRDLLVGVMAHEIGHVRHRHSLQQIYRALGVYALVGFLAGETGPVLDSVLLQGNLLLELAYSREHEFEADAFAVELTRRAGFDPAGLSRFFETLIAQGMTDPLPSWGSTHPPHQERIDTMRALIRR
jgi:Zn-dependent protease with chaperone function